MTATRQIAMKSASAPPLPKRSSSQIKEALERRRESAKVEVYQALRRFEAVSSRSFPRMPRIHIISDEECESCWGWKGAGSDQGDFIAPDLIRLSESSSDLTSTHEATHYARDFAKLNRSGAMPRFTYKAVDEMCAMFVEKAMSGLEIATDPLRVALNLYEIGKGCKTTDDATLLSDHIFLMQARNLAEIKSEEGASRFFAAAIRDAAVIGRMGSFARKESFYCFGKALAVLYLISNNLSVGEAVKGIMTTNGVGLLRKAVGQRLTPGASGFMALLESRLHFACSRSLGEEGGRPVKLKADEIHASVREMEISLALTYLDIFKGYHPARKGIGRDFISRARAQSLAKA